MLKCIMSLILCVVTSSAISAEEKMVALWSTDGKFYFFGVNSGTIYFGPYESAYDYSEGYAPVHDKSAGGWVYQDETGVRLKLGPYLQAYPFKQGIAPVQREDGWFYINKKGDLLSGPYKLALPFYEHCALILKNGSSNYSLVDLNFDILLDGLDISPLIAHGGVGDGGIWTVKKDGMWRFWHPSSGFLAGNIEADSVSPNRFGIARFGTGGERFGYISTVTGEILKDGPLGLSNHMGSWYASQKTNGKWEVVVATEDYRFGDFSRIGPLDG